MQKPGTLPMRAPDVSERTATVLAALLAIHMYLPSYSDARSVGHLHLLLLGRSPQHSRQGRLAPSPCRRPVCVPEWWALR